MSEARRTSSPSVAFSRPYLTPELEEHIAIARELRDRSRSDNTRRSYATGWKQFLAYLAEHQPQASPLPADPALVSVFLASLSLKKLTPETLRSRASAIAHYHRQAGYPSPCDHPAVKDLLEGAMRDGAGRTHGRATITLDDLVKTLGKVPPASTCLEIRDRAIALLTFASGRRRSEIAALNVEHLNFRRKRGFLFVWIAKSKSDQSGHGQFVAIPRLDADREGACAVIAVERWIGELGATRGPLFPAFVRSVPKIGSRIDGRVVADVLKRIYRQAGVSEEDVAAIAAHSLRRGFVTSADAAGMSFSQIGAVTGQKDPRTIARYAVHEITKDPPLLAIIEHDKRQREP